MNQTKINEVRHQQPFDVYIKQEVTIYFVPKSISLPIFLYLFAIF